MKIYIYSICLAFATFLIITNAQAQAKLVQNVEKKGDEFVIPFKKYVLPNGLTVILTEDHSDPIVHVDVTYHVGSAREEIGKSGFAHFFEHMMFEGSDHVPSGSHFKIINAAGGSLNGTTNGDRTNYFETVPSNQLEKMLWLESDRMGFLLDAVTQKKFENQRATVKNERGQNYDNRPYGLAREYVAKALYPYGHPYSWLTIGYIEDLNKVNVNDLKRFFLRWYGPNNATLTIGGDINSKQTIAWIEKYFGSIPRGPEVKPTKLPAPVIKTDRYISYTDNYARLPKLYVTYPGVEMYTNEGASLDALCMILGQGRNSIFYKNLVKNHKANDADMNSSNSELAGQINISVTPYPGQSLADIKKLVDASLKEFELRGVTDDDLARFKGQSETEFIGALASVRGKASELALAQTITGNPGEIVKELAEIRKVTKADVMQVYEKYIKGKGAVILSVLPKSGDITPAAPDNYKVDGNEYQLPDYGYEGLVYHKPHDIFNRSLQPVAGASPVVKVPEFWNATTANGIKMIGSYNNEIPTVNMILSIKGGGLMAEKDPSKAGLPYIVGRLLNDDTQQHSAEEINATLEKLGSNLGVYSEGEETSFYITSLTKNLDKTLALLNERLFHPKFTEEAFDRIKKQMVQNFQNARTQASSVTNNVWGKILYGSDNLRNYGFMGNEQTLMNINLSDVQAYYDHYFGPEISTIVVVGDIKENAIKEKLHFLDGWKNKAITIPSPDTSTRPIAKNTLYLVDVPYAAQSEISIGNVTGVHYDPTGTSYKLSVVGYSLGGGFNSRLNTDLREEKGWTYGANGNFISDRSGGTFKVGSSVKASVTDSAVLEMVKVVENYANTGITPFELEFTKSAIAQGEALKYETNSQKAVFLRQLVQYHLNPNYLDEQHEILTKITKTEVDNLAKRYLNVKNMAILVVGDKVKIMPGLQRIGYKVIELDPEGKVKELQKN